MKKCRQKSWLNFKWIVTTVVYIWKNDILNLHTWTELIFFHNYKFLTVYCYCFRKIKILRITTRLKWWWILLTLQLTWILDWSGPKIRIASSSTLLLKKLDKFSKSLTKKLPGTALRCSWSKTYWMNSFINFMFGSNYLLVIFTLFK